MPDRDGRLTPVRELLSEAVTVAERHARELGCEEPLRGLGSLLDHGGGAGRQRRVHEIAGMDALLRELTRATAG